jgi:hypothetical protein
MVLRKTNALMVLLCAAVFLTAARTHAQAPGTDLVRINCGGGNANPFVADTDFSGGTATSVTNSIATAGLINPAPAVVYQSYRKANSTYTIGGLTAAASYTVRLHFAECQWTSAGDREFDVAINGAEWQPSPASSRRH